MRKLIRDKIIRRFRRLYYGKDMRFAKNIYETTDYERKIAMEYTGARLIDNVHIVFSMYGIEKDIERTGWADLDDVINVIMKGARRLNLSGRTRIIDTSAAYIVDGYFICGTLNNNDLIVLQDIDI